MAEAAAAAATTAAATLTFKRSRIKPEVYKTTDGLIIVEDELLHFLSSRIKTLSQDEIVLLATNTFDTEGIEASKKVLFEMCPGTSQRNVAHKGLHKDANNIKLCLKVLNECGVNTPRFVSHYLEDLPPVSFTSIDTTCLLRRMEQLFTEVCSLKRVTQLQTEVCEQINGRVDLLERRPERAAGSDPGLEPASRKRSMESSCGMVLGTEPEKKRPRTPGNSAGPGVACEGTGRAASSCSPNGAAAMAAKRSSDPEMPSFSLVVKKGRPQQGTGNASSQKGQRIAGNNNGRARRPGAALVVGTSSVSSIKTVQTKLVSVFATKFCPELDAETLSVYLKEKLNREVTCHKIDSAHSRVGSFKVTAECKEVGELYAPDLWPEGSFIRRFYEPRRAVHASNTVQNGLMAGPSA